MPVVVEGGLHAPPWRSKVDASEGQKNRRAREAMLFLNEIESELDPDEFSLQEILEEHLCRLTERYDETGYLRYVNRSLSFLIEHGYIEILDEEEKTYRLVRENLEPPVPYEPII